MRSTDIIVIGGGHAGVEAASVAARMGASVFLITIDKSKIGVMSCNPAIGGIGKGHIVKELDALGGLMPIAADMSSIQYKVLNSSKGPAVRGPRCQADRNLYKKAVQKLLLSLGNVKVIDEMVNRLIIKNGRCLGVELSSGENVFSGSVVLTTGTFLNGIIYIGDSKTKAGRINESSSTHLGEFLKSLKLPMSRLKTGTPPRLLKNSIDFDLLEQDFGDNDPDYFSSLTYETNNKQVPCHVAWTNCKTHEFIKKSMDKSPLYNGKIESIGPRYCPSIEDKVHKFYSRNRHRVMLEPEGLNSDLIYPNGISTSLPKETQEKMICSMKGLEKAKIVQPGYAIEYDHIDPRLLKKNLECKKIKNLFFAGQINGTTGYEEAAGQGIIAGINAVLSINNKEPWILDRTEAYIGVMVDDLISRGAPEPYRMFTSRAEYRLYLRSDNADLRLSNKAIKIDILDEKRKSIFLKYQDNIRSLRKIIRSISLTPDEAISLGLRLSKDGKRRSLLELLGYEKINNRSLIKKYPQLKSYDSKALIQLQIESKYHIHLKKQKVSILSYKKDINLKIPKEIDYTKIGGLSKECCDALKTVRPEDLASASKIPGITAAALSSVLLYTKKSREKKVAG